MSRWTNEIVRWQDATGRRGEMPTNAELDEWREEMRRYIDSLVERGREQAENDWRAYHSQAWTEEAFDAYANDAGHHGGR